MLGPYESDSLQPATVVQRLRFRSFADFSAFLNASLPQPLVRFKDDSSALLPLPGCFSLALNG